MLFPILASVLKMNNNFSLNNVVSQKDTSKIKRRSYQVKYISKYVYISYIYLFNFLSFFADLICEISEKSAVIAHLSVTLDSVSDQHAALLAEFDEKESLLLEKEKDIDDALNSTIVLKGIYTFIITYYYIIVYMYIINITFIRKPHISWKGTCI